MQGHSRGGESHWSDDREMGVKGERYMGVLHNFNTFTHSTCDQYWSVREGGGGSEMVVRSVCLGKSSCCFLRTYLELVQRCGHPFRHRLLPGGQEFLEDELVSG